MWQYNHTDELMHYGVKGMKWGVRRSSNSGSSSTSSSSNRYKKVTKKIESSRRLIDESSNLTRKLEEATRKNRNKSKNKKMDLSSMTDQELRSKINREILERQYSEVFSSPTKADKGRNFVNAFLSAATTTLAVTSSALGIALAVRDLRKP